MDGTADHRRQNMYRRKLDESVLSKYRRHLTSLLRQIGDTEVRGKEAPAVNIFNSEERKMWCVCYSRVRNAWCDVLVVVPERNVEAERLR